MNLSQFRADLDASRRRTEAMTLDRQDSDLTSDLALAELEIAHEELRLCEQELRSQYDKLAEAHDALQKLRAADRDNFEFSPDALLITDAKGHVLDANQAMLSLLNIGPDSFAGMSLGEFIPDLDNLNFRYGLARLAAGEPTVTWSMTVKKHDTGELVVLSVRGRRGSTPAQHRSGAFLAGGPSIIRWSMHDITAQTVASSAQAADYMTLVRKNMELKVIISQLQGDIDAMSPPRSDGLRSPHRLILGLVEAEPMSLADVVRLCSDLVRPAADGAPPLPYESTIGELLLCALIRIDPRGRLAITPAGAAASTPFRKSACETRGAFRPLDQQSTR